MTDDDPWNPANMIRTEPCEQMPEGEFAVVSGQNVTIAKIDGSEAPRKLAGTELRRFWRWTLRRDQRGGL